MKRFLPILFTLIILLVSVQVASAQTTDDTITIPRSVFLKSKQAADEVVVSRQLIAALDRENALLRENGKLKDDKISLLESIVKITTEQGLEKDKTLAAVFQERDMFKEKSEKLERSNKRWKKVAKVAGGIALAFIVPKFF
jgi:hypothetical protein